MSDYNTKFQPYPVCPHCGHPHKDAWEWNFGPGIDGSDYEKECDVCCYNFSCDRIVDISYSTKKVES